MKNLAKITSNLTISMLLGGSLFAMQDFPEISNQYLVQSTPVMLNQLNDLGDVVASNKIASDLAERNLGEKIDDLDKKYVRELKLMNCRISDNASSIAEQAARLDSTKASVAAFEGKLSDAKEELNKAIAEKASETLLSAKALIASLGEQLNTVIGSSKAETTSQLLQVQTDLELAISNNKSAIAAAQANVDKVSGDLLAETVKRDQQAVELGNANLKLYQAIQDLDGKINALSAETKDNFAEQLSVINQLKADYNELLTWKFSVKQWQANTDSSLQNLVDSISTINVNAADSETKIQQIFTTLGAQSAEISNNKKTFETYMNKDAADELLEQAAYDSKINNIKALLDQEANLRAAGDQSSLDAAKTQLNSAVSELNSAAELLKISVKQTSDEAHAFTATTANGLRDELTIKLTDISAKADEQKTATQQYADAGVKRLLKVVSDVNNRTYQQIQWVLSLLPQNAEYKLTQPKISSLAVLNTSDLANFK